MTDAAARRPAAEKWLDLRHLDFALRFVARELGVRGFTSFHYDTIREKLILADKHRLVSEMEALLPTSLQLIQVVRRIEQLEAKKAELSAEAAATDSASKEAAEAGTSGERAEAVRKGGELPPRPCRSDDRGRQPDRHLPARGGPAAARSKPADGRRVRLREGEADVRSIEAAGGLADADQARLGEQPGSGR